MVYFTLLMANSALITMLYFCLKILHILSAALLLTSVGYSCQLWFTLRHPQEGALVVDRVQTQTWFFIIPLAIVQLATGFTLVSLEQNELSSAWITGAVVGFITVIGSWFSFIYFLLQAQQVSNQQTSTTFLDNKHKFFRRAQSLMLLICILSLFCMMFIMANKTTMM